MVYHKDLSTWTAIIYDILKYFISVFFLLFFSHFFLTFSQPVRKKCVMVYHKDLLSTWTAIIYDIVKYFIFNSLAGFRESIYLEWCAF